MNEKGQITHVLIFFVFSILLLFLFIGLIPMLQNMNTRMFVSAETIIVDTNDVVQSIQDEDIRQDLTDALGAQKEVIPTSVEILSIFFQYGWLVIIIVVLLILFMLTRETVERDIT